MNKFHILFIISFALCMYSCKNNEEVKPKAISNTNLSTNAVASITTTNTISGTANADFLTGTSANDQILAYAANDQVYANGGNDLVYGGKGDDFIQGNSGADVLRGDRGNDKLYGGTGNDELHGGKDNDELHGESNNDKLYGNKGNDMLYGGSGNDNYYYTLYDGTDVIDDASGTDVLYLQSISKSQVSVSYSGSNVILNVPSGKVTIKNGSVETVYANGQKVTIANNSTPNVPYYWQLNNIVYPYSSCQNTAIAMVINYFGGNTTPDAITNYYGKREAQTVPGFQRVFNSEAAHFGLSVRDRGTQYGSMSKLNQLLAQGKPVMAHGYTTSYGHLVVFLAFDGTYYTVHDPYGSWDGGYKSSGYYKTSTAGKFVKYHKNDVQAAFAPDGYVWLHEIYFQ